jgi:hypothetical protein
MWLQRTRTSPSFGSGRGASSINSILRGALNKMARMTDVAPLTTARQRYDGGAPTNLAPGPATVKQRRGRRMPSGQAGLAAGGNEENEERTWAPFFSFPLVAGRKNKNVPGERADMR